jgi:hypothetical protein
MSKNKINFRAEAARRIGVPANLTTRDLLAALDQALGPGCLPQTRRHQTDRC